MAFGRDPRLPSIARAGREVSFAPGLTFRDQLESQLGSVGFDPVTARNVARRTSRRLSRELRRGERVNLPGFVAGVTPGNLSLSPADLLRLQRAEVDTRSLTSGELADLRATTDLAGQIAALQATLAETPAGGGVRRSLQKEIRALERQQAEQA